MARLIGKSKKKRGLGVIERQGQDIKALQRAPQAGVLTVHKHFLTGGGAAGGGGATLLDDLTDVNAPAPADDDVLTWDDGAGEWIAAAGGGGGVTDSTFLM
ncbi:MAG: hypothetical protein MUO35_03790 [Anaerolineales bacterium]|nr:hypothetical protein [Anaerolineales bacterium]